MSSFLGHSLAAVTVYVGTESLIKSRSIIEQIKFLVHKPRRLIWLSWLIVIASVPDLDYAVLVWRSTNNGGLRITHSVSFSLIVPIFTIAILFLSGIRKRKLKLLGLQAVLAGLSHLVLDLSVGVTPLALLYPLINVPLKLPFGVLPSAGRIDFNNYYFYRSLKLEMGVLLPIFSLVCLWSDRLNYSKRRSKIKKLISISISLILMICLCYFIRINLALPR